MSSSKVNPDTLIPQHHHASTDPYFVAHVSLRCCPRYSGKQRRSGAEPAEMGTGQRRGCSQTHHRGCGRPAWAKSRPRRASCRGLPWEGCRELGEHGGSVRGRVGCMQEQRSVRPGDPTSKLQKAPHILYFLVHIVSISMHVMPAPKLNDSNDLEPEPAGI